jgi:hypothetical protein
MEDLIMAAEVMMAEVMKEIKVEKVMAEVVVVVGEIKDPLAVVAAVVDYINEK